MPAVFLSQTAVTSAPLSVYSVAKTEASEYVFEIPSNKFGLINILYSDATVLDTDYTENGARVTAVCDKKTAGKLSAYIVKM